MRSTFQQKLNCKMIWTFM